MFRTDAVPFLWKRLGSGRGGPFVGLVSWGSTAAGVELAALHGPGVDDVVLASDPLVVREGRLQVPALGFAWLAQE